jgi:hypothetical protein
MCEYYVRKVSSDEIDREDDFHKNKFLPISQISFSPQAHIYASKYLINERVCRRRISVNPPTVSPHTKHTLLSIVYRVRQMKGARNKKENKEAYRVKNEIVKR